MWGYSFFVHSHTAIQRVVMQVQHQLTALERSKRRIRGSATRPPGRETPTRSVRAARRLVRLDMNTWS